MDRVFVLHHVRKDDEYGDDAKMIGVYQSEQAAEAAIACLATQPGFIDHPSGFVFEPYELDKDHWAEAVVDPSDLPEDSN